MITKIFAFTCDDHGHDDDDPLKQEIDAETLADAKQAAKAIGWTYHPDGRTFCPACNARIKDNGRTRSASNQ